MSKSSEVVTYIKWRINSGYFQLGQKIPSENSLMKHFGISRTTVRSALSILKNEGYIVSRKSIGYFVSLSKEKLSFKGRNEQSTRKKFQALKDFHPTIRQMELMSKIGIDWERIQSDFSFGFINTYFGEDKPVSVVHSFINTKKVGIINTKKLADGLSSYFASKKINILKREELIVIEQVDTFIWVKLMCGQYDLIPIIISTMHDDRNEIVEIAFEYFIPSEFAVKKTITY